jgi:hypothetical protein
MTPNEHILTSAYKVAHGTLREPTDSKGRKVGGFCLAQARIIIEDAFGWPSHYWYEKYVTQWVQPDGYNRALGHWARDAERSLRNLGMSVNPDEREPGDLMFNWKAAYSQQWGAYIGHVGVLLHGDMVLENINPRFRVGKGFMRDSTGVTPLRAWDNVTTVIRFVPEGWGASEEPEPEAVLVNDDVE